MKIPTCHAWSRRVINRLAASTFIVSSTAVNAVPTAADPFLTGGSNYTIGTTNLVGQNPVATGFVGAWLPGGGDQSPDVIAGGLTYTDANLVSVAATGGAVEYPGGGNGRAGRLLTTTYNNASSGTVYFAVMIQLDTLGTGYRAFELHNENFNDGGANRKLQIFTREDPQTFDNNFSVRLFDNDIDGFAGDLGLVDTDVNFFVGKITFSTTGGADSLELWRNPTDLTSEAASGPPAFTKVGFDLQFDRVSIARFNGGDGIKADEIRLGSSWTDVTTAVNNTDADDDGLPDSYEQAIIDFDPNDLVVSLADVKGPLNAPATSDFDADDSSDAQEFARSTLPTNPDTDGDGLSDGPETLTGIFVSALNTGTNPLDNDSDDDGLRDGPEVTIHLTNPNIADTDRDGENDGTEVFQGTDPLLASSSSALEGRAVLDGVRDTALYGAPLAVQTVETQFGDNASEWNAAYSIVSAGKLYLLFTGNLEANFNKLSVFIDSTTEVASNTFTSAGNDGSTAMNGMIFDAGFTPDYHLIARRGSGKFDLDIAKLGASPAFTFSENVFGGTDNGRGVSITGLGNTQAILAAYNGSNTLGIGGGTGPADQAAAAAVTTGLELCIDLADIGNPTGPIKIMILQTSVDHSFLSNQSLAGLPAGTGNLGNPTTIDFGAFAGDQFFTVGGAADLNVLSSRLATPTQFEFIAQGLEMGATYFLQESTTLAGFSNLGASFEATGTVQLFSVAVTPGTVPKRFFRIKVQ